MNSDVNRADVMDTLHREMVDWRAWTGRTVVMAFAALAGLTVVAFTWMSELAFGAFEHIYSTSVVSQRCHIGTW